MHEFKIGDVVAYQDRPGTGAGVVVTFEEMCRRRAEANNTPITREGKPLPYVYFTEHVFGYCVAYPCLQSQCRLLRPAQQMVIHGNELHLASDS